MGLGLLKAGRQIVENSTLCFSHTQTARVGEPDDSSDRFLEKEVKQLCMKILQFFIIIQNPAEFLNFLL